MADPLRPDPTPPLAPLPGSVRELPAGARQTGLPDPQGTLEVTLWLRPRQRLVPHLAAAPLTRAAYSEAYGAAEDDLARVETFAHEHELSVVDASAARRTVILRGTVGQVEAAFGVRLALYQVDGRTFRGRSGPVSLPAGLIGVVEGVFGLDDRPQARPRFRLAGPPTGRGVAFPRQVAASFTPPELAALYGFPPGDGQGQTIAIIELGGGYRRADLHAYFTGLGLPLPRVTAVSVNGGHNAPSGDPDGADAEVMLDIEVAGAVAPRAHIAVYFAPNTDAGFLNAVTRAVHDTRRKPSVLSISWGAAEKEWTLQAMQALDEAFHAAALLGVTVLCAAGDDGSNDRVGDGLAHTDFPASSPWVSGCGGTRLSAAGGQITSEVVWNEGGGGATGGGVSDTFGLPDYQQGAGVPPSANPGAHLGRGVPDISAVADPQTGYRVRVDGQDTVIGGTSAVAPLWAGLVARLNARRGQPLGFLNPRLYPLGALRDITEGSNGAYAARPGWDACTGLGSPDGQKLAALAERPAGD